MVNIPLSFPLTWLINQTSIDNHPNYQKKKKEVLHEIFDYHDKTALLKLMEYGISLSPQGVQNVLSIKVH